MLEEKADTEAGEPFLRTRHRVPVRRRGGSGFLSRFGWKSRWFRVAASLIVFAALGLLAGAFWEIKSLLLHNQHFLLASTRSVQVNGNRVVSDSQVLALFARDTAHSVFRVPLAERQAELEQIRWVRHATVMRLWPNRLRVSVVERTPIAFAREGNRIRLVDDEGVLLDLPDAAAQHYSFPVLTGLSSSDPLSTRAARIDLYRHFVQALDANGENISAALSEVDLSDPEDVRAIFTGGARQPLVHLGASDFLPRYRAYSSHLAEWLRQYPQLQSVDMRYGRQVVLDTGSAGSAPAAPSVAGEIPTVDASPLKKSLAVHEAAAAGAVPARSKTETASRKKIRAASHRGPIHKIHKHPPARERGHSVRDPIMHVVSGA